MAGSFVILIPGRTGSSYLVSSLAGHPGIDVEGERLVGIDTVEEQVAWVNRHFRRRSLRGRKRGFKTKLKDVRDLDRFRDELEAHQASLILMLRRDPLRQAISVINARRLRALHGVWNRTEDVPELGPLELDLAELDQILEEVSFSGRQLEEFVSSTDLERIRIHYEDMLADPDAVVRSVQEFLGVPVRPLAGRTRKTTPDRLVHAITNHDELCRHFEGTDYEAFLDRP